MPIIKLNDNNMKLARIKFFLILLLLSVFPLQGQDYQYQYFADKDEYVPFSDYIPRIRLHYQTVPHYLEDYYLLYGMKLYYNETTLRQHIEMLETALKCKFRHPSQALVRVETEEEYLKYRKLMFMHINIMIMRNYLKIGARYDKVSIRFTDAAFAKEILESLDIAIKIYKQAIPYWEQAKKHAEASSRIKITTKMSNIESERYRIIKEELDYGKIIKNHIARAEKKKAQVQKYLSYPSISGR